ncbi:DUF1365 domain-containing protein [Undibacterium terreum]|uniref:DUF1365 domain-containing protein n=1 Tax=Undibacterium terreum TaxID=1224302 RepID=A0A916XN10_9BURK|nr:DUF1365 domain-containing protein [Undibacterium terreum]GGC88523.1 DUF1365 domain-containing protein [Undibacterium terreum]
MSSKETASIQLCTGEVRHKRLRPVQNAFSYGVFFARLPLRAMQASPAKLRFFSHNRFNLLSFHDKDHGDGKQPLLEWVDALLKQEGVQDADGEIWLQCFPRVLGYVFNPVSFWFCHREDGALRAIVVEVCNTFGEKHLYLLESGNGAPLGYGQELTAKKIFHVSPFCKIEGAYRFRFMRSERQIADNSQEHHIARIDYDDDAGPLLLTSISGIAQSLNDRLLLRAIARFPLMTLAVVARIHVQALRLWIKRVPFFSKPAPPAHDLSK